MSNFFVKIITSIVLAFMTVLNLFTGAGKPEVNTVDVNGSLVCTDSLGRSVVTAGESEKLVGVFYFLWHGQHGSTRIIDNSKLVSEHPEAVTSEEAWYAAGGGDVNEFHYWGEPLLGYYSASDEWIYRKHVQMLTDAAVDFIVIDTTNAFTYSEPAKKLISVWYEFMLQGYNVPKIAYYTNSYSAHTINRIYDEIYNNADLRAKYPELDKLWFYMNGKPMIVGNEYDGEIRPEVKEYFRIKTSQWPNEEKRDDGFPWMEFDRSLTYKSFYKSNGVSVMNVSVAQHSQTCTFSKTAWYGANDRSRSWHNGANDTSENAMLYGYNFAEQWEFALKMNPDIIFITGFNEWIAQRQPPQAEYQIIFVDCADENNSRDVEPSAGVLGDNYYMQMVNYIAKFKGTTAKVSRNENITVDISSAFSQWDSDRITSVYKDYVNDTVHRNSVDFAGNAVTDNSGRNDIVKMKVADDKDNYYFYVETADSLTSPDGGSWMTLFINENIVINRTAPTGGKTAVEINQNGTFTKISEADIRFEGNKLMLSVSKALVGDFDSLSFKWADNYTENDVYSFYTSGDAAPYGRLCYSY